MSRASRSVSEPLSTIRSFRLRRAGMAAFAVTGLTFTAPAVTASASASPSPSQATSGIVVPTPIPCSWDTQGDGLTTCAPEVATTASPASVVYGQGTPVTDVAVFDSEDEFPLQEPGLMSFYVCGPGVSSCDASGTFLTTNSLPAANDDPGDNDDYATSTTFTPTAVGNYCFFALFQGSGASIPEYGPDSVECFTVTPAPLTITASSGSFPVGGTPPTITPSYSGFVNGDTPATALTTPPNCTTTATSASPVGSYPSSCSGASAPNYTITYVPGTVTVTGAAPPTAAGSGSGPLITAGAATNGASPVGPSTVANATTVHTGEPWAGSKPAELGAGGAGIGLVAMGMRKRRRFRLASLWGGRG
jgi:hypothetical protein